MRIKTARFLGVMGATFGVVLFMSAAAEASLAAPKVIGPANRKTVQSLPAFTWKPVRRAAQYQFEFSANRNFSSGVNGFGTGPITLSTTALTNDQTIPDGTYYWRVRAVSAKDVPGRWSAIRRLTKRWRVTPKLLSPVGTTVKWPGSPLLLKWSKVPLAANYQVEIGTSPALSNLVYGPVDVQGPEFAVPTTLSPGTYYWAVQPIDGSGNLGARSAVKSFTWAWPSDTSLNEADTSPDSTYEEPTFSWTPIAGAAGYEVQVATDPSYPANAIILDSTVISPSYTSTAFFPNHTTLYWRVRALDARNDAGSWNNGESFTELFDQNVPSIPNFHVVNSAGAVDDYDTADQDPIVRWSPVAGASEYTLTFVPWAAGSCNFNGQTYTVTTPSTAWTPGGGDANINWEASEYGWPNTADSATDFALTPGSYCLSLIAVRSAGPLAGSLIESAPTVLGGAEPAFTYVQPVPTGTLNPGAVNYSPGVVQPAYGLGAPSGGSITTMPLFEWTAYPGADGYYVIIANDEQFDPNSIVTGGYTNTTSWAPARSLPDQTAAFWWEVIPVTAGGAPLGQDSAQNGSYDPQQFDKNSTPPQPIGPVGGANVATQPTFSWHSAQGAVSYTLEISADPSFANPIETDSTVSTLFTTATTLPAGKTLYWRVRANDVTYDLNWSAVQTFTHNLPAPATLSGPKGGSTVPLLSWTPVAGASAYNVHFTTAGNPSTVSVSTAHMTPAEFFGPGLTKWSVQAVFPGGATSSDSHQIAYKRTLPAPGGIRATKSGSRILVTWKPDSIAKAYVIQLATTPGFASPLVSDTTVNTAWVPQITAVQAKTKLYWRLAVVDDAGNVGAYHTGVFKAPPKPKPKPKKKKTKKKK